MKESRETWGLGSSLQPDEQRYVLELFPESRGILGLTDAEWLSQVEFLVKKDGLLDLRKRYCRLPEVPGEPDRRYHRAPRYQPLPDPPRRREQCEQQQSASGEDPQEPYAVRVWNAYRELAEQYQSPDIPIHAMHGRIGGSIHELHEFLRAESLAHRAVATTGEPAFAGDAARQSALTLPGESETFLNIKLLNPPIMNERQQQPPKQQRQAAGLNRDDLQTLIEALEYRCEAIETGTDFDEVARLKSIVPTLEKLRALEAQPQRPEHERYENLLRATAALRYPPEERTAELEARIEKTIARKVGEFTQERRAKAYEAGLRRDLAERHPNLTPDQAQRYERRINELVAEFRQSQAQRQQQQARTPARSQQQAGDLNNRYEPRNHHLRPDLYPPGTRVPGLELPR
jgi:hypothetical protein